MGPLGGLECASHACAAPGRANTAGDLATAYRYTGQHAEPALELYYYNARWYDPLIGRFLSPDVIMPAAGRPSALNRYTYVLNNPVRYTDPTGHAYDAGGAYSGPDEEIVRWLATRYGITVNRRWSRGELVTVQHGVMLMKQAVARTTLDGSLAEKTLRHMLGDPVISRLQWDWMPAPLSTGFRTFTIAARGGLPNAIFFVRQNEVNERTGVHEFGHMIDYTLGLRINQHPRRGGSFAMENLGIDKGESPSGYGETSYLEDFAESWTVYVLGHQSRYFGREVIHKLTENRQRLMESLVVDAWWYVKNEGQGWTGVSYRP